MKKIITCLSLACASIIGFSQNHIVQHNWGGMINTNQDMGVQSIDSDNEGNTYVAMTVVGNPDFDLTSGISTTNYGSSTGGALVKYDAEGALVWKNTFDGTDSRSYSVTAEGNGDVVVSGIFKNSLRVNGVTKFTGTSNWNGFVIKFKADGTYDTGATFPTTGDTYLFGTSIDAQHNIYISGYTAGTIDLDPNASTTLNVTAGTGKSNSFVAKYDASMNILWGTAITGAVNVYSRSVTQDDNNVYVGGYIETGATTVTAEELVGGASLTTTGAARASNGYVLVIDKATGTPKHIENIIATGGNTANRVRVFDIEYSKIDNALVVASDYSGNIATDSKTIAGNIDDAKRTGLILKYKINTTGDLLTYDWAQRLLHGNGTSYAMVLRDVDVDASTGNIATSADSRGGLKSQKNVNGVTGSTLTVSTLENGNNEGFGIIFDKRGDLVEHFYIGGSIAVSQVIDLSNDVCTIGGWYRGNVDLDATTGSKVVNGGNYNSIGLTQHKLAQPLSISFVDKLATGKNNGTSWDDAYTSLSNAIALTNDTVLIKSGTYTGVQNFDKNIVLIGGFDGTEFDISDRDLKLNKTVFDGNLTPLHVVEVTADTFVLDGFVIQNSKQTSTSAPNNSGAGLYYVVNGVGGSFTLKNCEIKDNKGYTQGAGFEVNVDGANIYNVKIENCHIHDNSSRYAPAWIAISKGSSTLNLDFVNNLVENNATVDQGGNWIGFKASAGGMISGFGTSKLNVNIVNSTFANNKNSATGTQAGNALICVSERVNESPVVNVSSYNSIYYGNESTESFGYWQHSAAYTRLTDLTLVNNISEDTPNSTYGVGTVTVTGHSSADPLFTDAANRDYTLKSTSTAIDAGSTAGITALLPEADLAGNSRIKNTIDLGAYEYGAFPLSIFGNNEANELLVFPNPASDDVQIDSREVVNVKVVDASGILVIETSDNKFNVSSLNEGLYLLHIKTIDGVYVQKFIKE